MSTIRKKYPFDLIEKKWQSRWDEQAAFKAWNPGDSIPDSHPFSIRHSLSGTVSTDQLPKKYYILDMFPYPSGEGLHVGHPEGYTATDILARYHRALGCNVLHPIGWDAFGLPAEQYAIRTGKHPRETTTRNISTFKRQIKSLGFSYDWSRELDTTDPGYFRWTQWIFLQIYNSWFNPKTQRAEPIKTLPIPDNCASEAERRAYQDQHRLAYVADAPVNWCPALGTVLANEEVIDGKSEVGGHPVIRKPMRQWMLRITAYADRLLQDLEGLDWSRALKEMQRNWIGRSEGAEVRFPIPDTRHGKQEVTVFTTRPDTLFGATYMVLSPEHSLVPILTTDAQRAAVEAYQQEAARKSDLERTDLAKTKTGVFTGAFALNPVNQESIPIWIADYVLSGYGTGAIMAVPGHDERDLEFAREFNLPIRVVVQAPQGAESVGFTGDGVSVESGFLTGLPTPQAKAKILDWLEEKGHGKRTIQFKLRDWLFSRQRYWGEPFPIVWDSIGHRALNEADLPVLPPSLTDYKPTESGEPPLARAKDWVRQPDGSVRETNTMPQWAGSCWYYLRYIDPKNANQLLSSEAQAYWMKPPLEGAMAGIDLYVGGAEHAVLHLLYARFWHKILFDLGHVSTPEPFHKLVNQGLILGEDNNKMSKSRGNVVNPDDIIRENGADALRLFEMFMGPLEMVKPWSNTGVEGVYRFLGRVWRLVIDEQSYSDWEHHSLSNGAMDFDSLRQIQLSPSVQDIEPTSEHLKVLHTCIQKVTEELNHMRFNTGISALMIFLNEASSWPVKPVSALKTFMILLQPYAPHLAEELFGKLVNTFPQTQAGYTGTIAYEPWPKFDPLLLVEDTVEVPIQVNGKIRDKITVQIDLPKDSLERLALDNPKAKAFMEGKSIVKVIVVPGKLVNIVVK